MAISRKVLPIFIVTVVTAWCGTVFADPPRHAPAHGWRKQHDPYYVGYYGTRWDHDFEILAGHCDREAVATVLGGVVGAVIGSRIADRDDRTVATIIGAAAGALLGNKIGREMDEADRSCVGHSLEMGKPGQHVVWTNESSGVSYDMKLGDERPTADSRCREFTLVAVAGREKTSEHDVACQSEQGVWHIEG